MAIKIVDEGYTSKVFLNGIYLGRLYEGNGKYYASRPLTNEEVEFNSFKNGVRFLLLVKEDYIEQPNDSSNGVQE